MTARLADSLPVLVTALPSALTGPDTLQVLTDLSGQLAPVLRGGFECRLKAGEQRVDLQLCVTPEEPALRQLRQQIHAAGTVKGLGRFLDSWTSHGSGLQASVPEIWLELDMEGFEMEGLEMEGLEMEGPGRNLPLPAVFTGLPQDIRPATASLPVAREALELLLGAERWAQWRGGLERCFHACPDGVFISHVGAMLSRQTPALRVNVKRLDDRTLFPYLERVGWDGDATALGHLTDSLLPLVERLTLCLDVGERVFPELGLECICSGQPPVQTRWSALLDHLVGRSWCDPAKAEALLEWPGRCTPLDTKVDWPGHLIAESLLRPANTFGIFERRLSHLKLTWRPNAGPEAKGYLWFQHHWRNVP